MNISLFHSVVQEIQGSSPQSKISFSLLQVRSEQYNGHQYDLFKYTDRDRDAERDEQGAI